MAGAGALLLAVSALLAALALAVNPRRQCWHPRCGDRLVRLQMAAVVALTLAAVVSAVR